MAEIITQEYIDLLIKKFNKSKIFKKSRTGNLKIVEDQTRDILEQFLKDYPQKRGSIFVIGCSTSEVDGGVIGQKSNEEIGQVIFETAEYVLSKRGIYLACQCCEHLNRALVMEKNCAIKYGYEEVCVVPWAHAGGSFATAAYKNFSDPVVVEHIKASAGIDIGDTLIGMHLQDVAVPVHLEKNCIGNAHVVAAYCRPKLIGGERAHYNK